MNSPEDFQGHLNPLLLHWLTNNSGGGLGSNGGGGMTTSAVGGDLADCLDLEDLNKIVEILESRKRLHSQPSFTLASGNFLPSSSLQEGARLSIAVCRIARNFSVEGFQQEIINIQSSIQDLPDQIKNLYKSSKTLQEIFSIPEGFFNNKGDDALQFLSSKSSEDLSQLLSQINPVPWATGFLVGGSHLLTNYHVIPTKEVAKQAIAQFNYIKDGVGEIQTVIEYEFDPDALFVSNSLLDYTLIQLKSGLQKKPPGYQMGWIPLVEKEDAIAPGLVFFKQNFEDLLKNIVHQDAEENRKLRFPLGYYDICKQKIDIQDVYILWQSPRSIKRMRSMVILGEFKEVEPYFQRVENDIKEIITQIKVSQAALQVGDINQGADTFINSHEMGEPVIIIQHPKGRTQEIVLFENRIINNGLLKNYLRYTADADYGSSGSPVFNVQWELVALHHAAIPNFDTEMSNKRSSVAQQGIRICQIVKDLKQNSFRNSKLKNFIEDFVITAEQFKYPPLPAALELDGLNDYIQIDAAKTDDSQAFTVEAWINSTGQQEKSTIFTAFCQEVWAEEESTLGDLLLHCYLTPAGELVLSRKKVFSSYPASSMLFPASRLSLFYPKRYPAPPSLRIGEKSIRIRRFKQFFNLIPRLTQKLSDTDEFDQEMFGVITTFQGDRKLEKDGIVGRLTLDALWQLIRFEQGNSSPVIEDIRYLLTLINAGLKEPFPEAMLEVLQQPSEQFCEQTKAAVELFQEDRKLEVEEPGAIDSITLDALWAYGLYLREGNQAQSVKDLQSLLNHLGHEVPTTRIFDPDTIKAVRRFQKRNQLGIDGVVGQRTMSALMNDRLYAYELRAQKFDWFFTKDFIRKFQVDNNLDGDGLPGRLTIDKMVEKTKLTLGAYSHVAVTYDGEIIRLLVNGEELLFSKEEYAEPSKRKDYLKLGNDRDTDVRFLVGAYAEVAERIAEERSCHFQGNIADLRVWKRDRTEEIETELKNNCFHRRLTGDEAGLSGYWRFEEAEISVTAETSTLEDKDPTTNQPEPKALPNRAINAELTGKIVSKSPRFSLATQFPALPLPFGLEFKEAGSTLSFPKFRFDSGNTKPITTITIEAWVRYTFGNGFIVSQRADAKKGFSVGFEDERLFVELQAGEKQTRVEMESRFPSDLIWHHVAMTLNSQSEIWMYLDGHVQPIVVVQADKAKSMMVQGRRRQIGLFESSIDLKDSTLYIGKWEDGAPYFHVAISEVRIWKTARTQDEIKVNQFCRLEGNEPGLVGYWRLDDGGQDNRVRDSSPNNVDGKSDSLNPPSWYPSPPSRSFL